VTIACRPENERGCRKEEVLPTRECGRGSIHTFDLVYHSRRALDESFAPMGLRKNVSKKKREKDSLIIVRPLRHPPPWHNTRSSALKKTHTHESQRLKFLSVERNLRKMQRKGCCNRIPKILRSPGRDVVLKRAVLSSSTTDDLHDLDHRWDKQKQAKTGVKQTAINCSFSRETV